MEQKQKFGDILGLDCCGFDVFSQVACVGRL